MTVMDSIFDFFVHLQIVIDIAGQCIAINYLYTP